MKQMKNILSLALLATLLSTTGCTNGYEDFNQDPYAVTKEEMQRNAYSLGAATQDSLERTLLSIILQITGTVSFLLILSLSSLFTATRSIT